MDGLRVGDTPGANITTALRHHAQRPHRPLQTLKTR